MQSQSDQIGEIAAALAQAQGGIGNPSKNKTVNVKTRQGGSYQFSYSTLDQIIETIRPAMVQNKLWVSQLIGTDEQGNWSLRTLLMHASGQWLATETPIPVEDAGIQELGKAVTYIRRYALASIVGVASEEDDDANSAVGNQVQTIAHRPLANNPEPLLVTSYAWSGSTEPQGIIGEKGDFIGWCQLFLSAIRQSNDAVGWVEKNQPMISTIQQVGPAIYNKLMAQIDKRIAEIEASKQKIGADVDGPPSPEKPAAASLIELDADFSKASSTKQLNAVYASHEAAIRDSGQEHQDAAVRLFLNHEQRIAKSKPLRAAAQ